MSSGPGARAQTALRSGPVSGPPGNGSGRLALALCASGSRPAICRHASGRQAARVIASHPEQGWSLLRNGVMGFGDTGPLLPGGPVIEPGPMAGQPGIGGTPQAGHVQAVDPVPSGRARKGGARRLCPAIAGGSLARPPAPSVADGDRSDG
jgi:hypothetical protein